MKKKKCFRNGSSLSCDVGPWSGPIVDAVDPDPGVGPYVGPDVGPDVGPYVGIGVCPDVDPDVGPYVGPDAGPDVGPYV